MTDDVFLNRLSSLPSPLRLVDFELAVFDLMKTGTPKQRKVLLEMLGNRPESEQPNAEKRISRALCQALERIGQREAFIEAPELRLALMGLQVFLPQILAEVYPYWVYESLDGIYLSEARKIGSDSVELRGLCTLISDQTITPFHVQMQISPSGDEINWMECRLGKRGNGNGDIERIPWPRSPARLHSFLQDTLQPIDWTYKVTFGEERRSA